MPLAMRHLLYRFWTCWNVMSSKIEFMCLTACYDVGKVTDLNEWRFPFSWSVTAFGNMRTQLRTTQSLLLQSHLMSTSNSFSDSSVILCHVKQNSSIFIRCEQYWLSPPRTEKIPSKLMVFRPSSTSMKYVADYSWIFVLFVSDVHQIDRSNDKRYFLAIFVKGAIFII